MQCLESSNCRYLLDTSCWFSDPSIFLGFHRPRISISTLKKNQQMFPKRNVGQKKMLGARGLMGRNVQKTFLLIFCIPSLLSVKPPLQLA